jgi:regulator of sigma E protease
MTFALGITAFVVAILLAVLVHELGHLVTAKLFGMRADRYFVGFGPTLWSTRRGETEYGVKAFPLGGFVSIRGMSPLDERRRPVVDEVFDPQALSADREQDQRVVTTPAAPPPTVPPATWERLRDTLLERGTPATVAQRIVERTRATIGHDPDLTEARTSLAQVMLTEVGDSERVGDLPWRLQRGDEGRFYHDRPRWQRALAIFLGPVTHLLIAFGLLLGGYLLIAQPTGEPTTEVAVVLEDSPAEEAGLAPGDRLRAVEGVESEDFERLRQVLRQRPGQPTTLTVERDGEVARIELVPLEETDPGTGETIGVAGFVPGEVSERLGPVDALQRAAVGDEDEPIGGVVPMLGASVQGLAAVFSPAGLSDLVSTSLGAQERDPEGAVSVVGIASFAGGAAEQGGVGLFALLFLLAYINVFLFIFNMVPLPPFDGGHLAVLAVEKLGTTVQRLRGRPETFTVDPRAITAVALPVIGVLLLVFATTLWLDIIDPITFG